MTVAAWNNARRAAGFGTVNRSFAFISLSMEFHMEFGILKFGSTKLVQPAFRTPSWSGLPIKLSAPA